MDNETKLKYLITVFQIARDIKCLNNVSYKTIFNKAYRMVDNYILVNLDKEKKLIAMRATCLERMMVMYQEDIFKYCIDIASLSREVNCLIEEMKNNTLSCNTKYTGFVIVKVNLFTMYLDRIYSRIIITSTIV